MLKPQISLLALLPLLLSAGGSHGKLDWFAGSYEELLAEAARTQRPIFLDFFTSQCAPCRLMDGQTFSDPEVVKVMSDFLCYPINGDLPETQDLSKQMRVTMFPALVFLDSKGAPVEKFEGFRPPRTFLREVKTIQEGEFTIPGLRAKLVVDPNNVITLLDLAIKLRNFGDSEEAPRAYSKAIQLIGKNAGFDADDVEARFAIATRLQNLGDGASATAQFQAIQALDPEGKSRPMRRIAFDQAARRVHRWMDDTDLRQLLVNETDHEMLHEGWHAISTCENHRAQRAKLKKELEDAAEYRRRRRQGIREAFRYASAEQSLTYGLFVTQLHLDELDDLAEAEKLAALAIAEQVATDASNDAECLDLFAQWLAHTGDRARALEIAKRCVKLDPTRMRWRGRVAEYQEE